MRNTVIVKAKDVKVGDSIIKQAGPYAVTVQEIRTNPHYGYIGFVYGPNSFDFCGWFLPDNDVAKVA